MFDVPSVCRDIGETLALTLVIAVLVERTGATKKMAGVRNVRSVCGEVTVIVNAHLKTVLHVQD